MENVFATVGTWAIMTTVVGIVAIFFYFLTVRPYLECFTAPLPSGTNIGPF
jgi:hypothetical protein